MQNTLLNVVVMVSVSGALGGLLLAMKVGSSYRVPMPFTGKPIPTGVAGDAFAGAVAGVAVMFTTTKIFGTPLDTPVIGVDQGLRLLSLGLLSGFAGMGLVESLTGNFTREINEATARAEESKNKLEQSELVRDALREARFMRQQGDYVAAKDAFYRVLELD